MPQEQNDTQYATARRARQRGGDKSEDKAIVKPKVEGEWHGSEPGAVGGTLDRNVINPGEMWLDSVKYKQTKT